jgi:decaprenylphospho-beta-D-ribofuranose 2-oxidase
MINGKRKLLSGWGNYPVEPGNVYETSGPRQIKELLHSSQEKYYIVRGLGRSYGDTALNKEKGIILQKNDSKIISFDANSGMLTCTANITFEELLTHFLPQGYFPPVTPGTKYITLGGAIANDIHGKNHHCDGSIANFILSFTLLIGTGETLDCSREQNSDIFWATVGGIGLTGIILKVTMKLIPIETSYIKVHYHKAKNLDEALDTFIREDDSYQYSVAWIDCLATGKSLGRSVLMHGNHVPIKELPSYFGAPLQLSKKRKVVIPFHFPSSFLNLFTIKAFNQIYYHSSPKNGSQWVDYDRFFYPLDAIVNWNRAYGRKGFIQYQVVFPYQTSREALMRLLTKLNEEKTPSFLAVLKRFGKGNQAPLSFPFKGFTLALDSPFRGKKTLALLGELDEMVVQYGGRVYLAKDSTLSSKWMAHMYPNLQQLLKIKKKVDPHRYFSSSMSRRLNLTGDQK